MYLHIYKGVYILFITFLLNVCDYYIPKIYDKEQISKLQVLCIYQTFVFPHLIFSISIVVLFLILVTRIRTTLKRNNMLI